MDSPDAPRHEIGKRTYLIAPVEPLDVDGVRTVQVGTALFFLAFLALLPFYGRLSDCLLYTSPSPRDKRQSRMPSSA